MIDIALTFLRKELNSYLKRRKGASSHQVEFTLLTSNNGEGKDFNLGMSLVNLEEERKIKDQRYFREDPQGNLQKVNPELKLNMYVLFTAKLEDHYDQALEYLSLIVQFFQANTYFNTQTHPAIDPNIQKLIAELYTMSFEQQNNLWGSLSTRYLPSVLYKIRLVAIQDISSPESVPTWDTGQFNLGTHA